jgi:hypothetical protein
VWPSPQVIPRPCHDRRNRQTSCLFHTVRSSCPVITPSPSGSQQGLIGKRETLRGQVFLTSCLCDVALAPQTGLACLGGRPQLAGATPRRDRLKVPGGAHCGESPSPLSGCSRQQHCTLSCGLKSHPRPRSRASRAPWVEAKHVCTRH